MAGLNTELIEERIDIIESSYKSLSRFRSLSREEFRKDQDNFRIAFYDIHTALEAVLDIGAHILSRIPGRRTASYKDIALFLGEEGVIPEDFCEHKLLEMAGYCNRLVHFYNRINRDEIYGIIKNNLDDFNEYISYIKKYLKEKKGSETS